MIMAISERIRFFRNLRGLTQKQLGMMLGFPERSADVRMAQYETGARTPKTDVTNNLSSVFGVSPLALTVPDIDTNYGLMHTLFALEDIYGLEIDEIDGEACIRFDHDRSEAHRDILERCAAWLREAERFRSGEITKEEYDHWRYTYPEVEAQRTKERLDVKRNETEG
jgi:transcriptional regulator with XRE-family HTH domain